MPEDLPPTRPTLFATTRWTLVIDAAGGEEIAAREALEALARTYWHPFS